MPCEIPVRTIEKLIVQARDPHDPLKTPLGSVNALCSENAVCAGYLLRSLVIKDGAVAGALEDSCIWFEFKSLQLYSVVILSV